ncbi:hypothetical protein EVAR_76599_1 [Eumeta japonica]|uniref:Uncharacterized protein n=1 Tax=Eumeta variegata TaxID=151549 RepID=A0A4C1T600_EUMVA|nr:hypothetical protein EVAR_76599_1 [Eumeta japonica]
MTKEQKSDRKLKLTLRPITVPDIRYRVGQESKEFKIVLSQFYQKKPGAWAAAGRGSCLQKQHDSRNTALYRLFTARRLPAEGRMRHGTIAVDEAKSSIRLSFECPKILHQSKPSFRRPQKSTSADGSLRDDARRPRRCYESARQWAVSARSGGSQLSYEERPVRRDPSTKREAWPRRSLNFTQVSCDRPCACVEHVGPLGRAENRRVDPTVSLGRFTVTS